MSRSVKRGVLATSRAAERHAIIKQDFAAIDQFGELPSRKRDAMRVAHDARHAHNMTPWHERKNDPFGRWNSYCRDCNRAMVVCTEPVPGFDLTYGPALLVACVEEPK